MTDPDHLYWVRRLAESSSVPEAVRAHAEAFMEHFLRAKDLGWSNEEAWRRAEQETSSYRKASHAGP